MPTDHRRSGRTVTAVLTSVLLVTSLSLLAKGPGQATQAPGSVTSRPAVIVDDAAMSDDGSGDNWLAFGRTLSEQRFSPLKQIDDANVGEPQGRLVHRPA